MAAFNEKTNIKKNVIIGFLVGLLATTIGFYFYTQIINQFSIKFVKKMIVEGKMLGMILIYSAIPNLLAFFVFLKRNEDYKAKGVLLATFLVALIILSSEFMY